MKTCTNGVLGYTLFTQSTGINCDGLVKREEESMVRVVLNLRMKGKRPSQRWLNNIDSHVNGKKTSPKEILGNFWRIWREMIGTAGVLEAILLGVW